MSDIAGPSGSSNKPRVLVPSPAFAAALLKTSKGNPYGLNPTESAHIANLGRGIYGKASAPVPRRAILLSGPGPRPLTKQEEQEVRNKNFRKWGFRSSVFSSFVFFQCGVPLIFGITYDFLVHFLLVLIFP